MAELVQAMRDGEKETITINTPKTQTPYTARNPNPKPKNGYYKRLKKKKKKKTSSLLSHPFLSMPDLDKYQIYHTMVVMMV
jgi:hypothetical protein